MIQPSACWLLGLPCIGKTTNLKGACKQAGMAYIEATSFREAAWQDLMIAKNVRSKNISQSFLSAYIQAFSNIDKFVQLHINVAPYLIARIQQHVKTLDDYVVVIEASSLYQTMLPDACRYICVTDETSVHKQRIAHRLDLDEEQTNIVYWTLKMTEYRLKNGHIHPVALSLSNINEILRKLV